MSSKTKLNIILSQHNNVDSQTIFPVIWIRIVSQQHILLPATILLTYIVVSNNIWRCIYYNYTDMQQNCEMRQNYVNMRFK